MSFSSHAIEKRGKVQAYGGSFLGDFEDEDVTTATAGVEGALELQKKLTKTLRFQLDNWVKYDGLTKSDEETFQHQLEEASIDYKKSSRKLKLGVSKRVWEGTDLINPMDIIHTKNYMDPLNARPLSAPGFFYDDSAGDFSWDFTYLAIQQKPRFPGTESPWLPRKIFLPIESDKTVLLLPEEVEYRYLTPLERDNALSNNFALRLQYIGSNLDVSVAAFEGVANPPLLMIETNVTPTKVDDDGNVTEAQADDDVGIKPIYYRQRAVAFTTTLTLGEWIFRASANHLQPLGDHKKPDTPSWAQLGVIGLEKSFYFKSQMLTVILQAVGSHKPDSGGMSLLSSLYEKSFMVALRYAPNEKWTWLNAYFQEQKYFSHFYHTELTWNFKDPWSLALYGNFFQGTPSSPIGNFSQNDQLLLKAGYSF